ncbi:UTRA domain-containing protein [Photobacterium profundum]|uniref:Putative transcriptional regulator n=1 Tax=Photobacterium profundum 3TCK TaxID=314280 RepID=Q1ZAH2_9GAMM|nr:UTRA domain-containing protein [Photobacterium profundum]EAS45520.1 putative transcriptional regulator [Photobacterium profundum 3TCK]PSV63303.1 UTRA domain-containing protein [Photobacterium profundum]
MKNHGISQLSTIRETLNQQIDSGLFSTRSKLPSERELSDIFETSRITIKDALVALETEGKIYREERRGWFVAPEKRLRYNPLSRSHFHKMVAEQKRCAETQLLSVYSAPAGIELMQTMALDTFTKVHHVHRLRYLDKRPVLYVENCLIAEHFPDILEQDLTRSLTELYKNRYQHDTSRSQFEVLPTAAKGIVAKKLNLAEGQLVLKIRRVNYNQHGVIIDCEYEHWRHDAVMICIDSASNI